MPGIGLGIGTGLSGFVKGYNEGQQALGQKRLLQQLLARNQREAQQADQQQQAQGTLFQALSGMGDSSGIQAPATPNIGAGLDGGSAAPQPPMPGQSSVPSASAGAPQTGSPVPLPPPSPGGGNWETQHNNFAGLRKPDSTVGPEAGGFQSFDTPQQGIQAVSDQLDRYAKGGVVTAMNPTGAPLTTLRKIVSVWAPPADKNDTPALIARAAQVMNVDPDAPLNVGDPAVKAKLIEALTRGEQGGKMPVDPAMVSGVVGGKGGSSAPVVPPAVRQQATQITQGVTSTLPQGISGQMSLQALARQIEKVAPDASPAVKMMALEQGNKLLAPTERVQMQLFMEQQKENFRTELETLKAEMKPEPTGQVFVGADGKPYSIRGNTATPIAGIPDGGLQRPEGDKPATGAQVFTDPSNNKQYLMNPNKPGSATDLAGNPYTPGGAAKVGSGNATVPPELKVPDKWEGMPDKAPPGVRQDAWQAALEYVRTGKMPSLGFQAGMRNLVMQASPAAAQALGMQASKVADLQAQYAGERHGEIVGGGRAANIELGIQEAKKAAPQVIATSKDVPRNEWPAINQFTNWLNEKTGDPNVVAFRQALNTYLNVYAATVSRSGRLTDAQQRHAYDLLSTAFSQGQIDRGIQQLDYEMSLMHEAVPPAMENIQSVGQPPAIQKQETPATPPQQGSAGGGQDGEVVIQNGYQYRKQGDQYVPIGPAQ